MKISKLSQILTRPAHTRVAPSPTGHVHLGTLRTALHNWLAAKASGGAFLLRIDDTHGARNNPTHAVAFQRLLDDMGMSPDQTVWQSQRFDVHRAAAASLVGCGLAQVKDGATVLTQDIVDLTVSSFVDLASGDCRVSKQQSSLLPGAVLIRSDGTPTYMLASIVDDIDHSINLIIRGVDHLSNTPKQLAIAAGLASAGWPNAADFVSGLRLAHVGLIMIQGKTGPVKLSKRDAASSVIDLRAAGISDRAILHVAMMLGWGHPDPQFDKAYPVMSSDDMKHVFGQGALRAGNAMFQPGRLAALDRKYKARGL